MLQKSAVAVLAASAFAWAVGCGVHPVATQNPDGGLSYSGAGPIDGTWKETAYSCNGTSQTMTDTFTMTINNTTGSIQDVQGGCTESQPITIGYPTTSSITVTNGAKTCSGTCSPGCGGSGGGDGGSGQNSQTFSYVLSGSTLTVSQVTTSQNQGCPAGQTVAYTLTKQ